MSTGFSSLCTLTGRLCQKQDWKRHKPECTAQKKEDRKASKQQEKNFIRLAMEFPMYPTVVQTIAWEHRNANPEDRGSIFSSYDEAKQLFM